jgi:hypothetical protein
VIEFFEILRLDRREMEHFPVLACQKTLVESLRNRFALFLFEDIETLLIIHVLLYLSIIVIFVLLKIFSFRSIYPYSALYYVSAHFLSCNRCSIFIALSVFAAKYLSLCRSFVLFFSQSNKVLALCSLFLKPL